MKKIIFIIFIIFCTPLFAHDCLTYKVEPTILLSQPEYEKTINFSAENMPAHHGKVEANITTNYDVVLDMYETTNGFCVVLSQIKAIFGFNKFDVLIDKQHETNICAYNAVLHHEEKHIEVYLNIIKDFKNDIHDSLYTAADSVMPIFIEKESDIELAFEELNQEFISHPDLLLIAQKVYAAQEIRNKQIDQNEDNGELNSCYN